MAEFKKEEIVFEEAIPFVMYETNARQVLIHSHDCLEINLICRGKGHYLIEDSSYEIREKDIFVINNSEHHMAVHDGSLWMLVFVFSPEFVWNNPEEYAYLSPFFERGARFSNRIAQDFAEYDVMSGCLEKISEEYEKKSPGWELMVKANLLMFLAYANRYYMQKGALRREEGNFRYSRIREAVAYIHAHFDKELTLEELAAQAAMGKSYFSSYFTEVMKMRVFDYIERVRVNHGAMLLKSTEDSVLEVALQSGFHSSSYFNRVFKKIWKTTPSAYRKSKDSTKNQE